MARTCHLYLITVFSAGTDGTVVLHSAVHGHAAGQLWRFNHLVVLHAHACTLNNLTRVIQQFSNILPYDILGRSWILSFQAQARLTDWVGTSTVLAMVTSEAAVGIIKRPLCLSISMDESLCVPALLAGMILQVSDPSPRSAAAADVKAVQTSSYCACCHHLLLTCQCSCAPLIHTQPKVEIKWLALCLWVSSSHICRRLGPDKNPHVLPDCWVCVWSWPRMEVCPIYLCASHLPSNSVDETQ